MDRTRNDSQDTWRGASGAEDIEVLHGRSPHASKRWLGAGWLIGAVLLCGVVFVSVPNPKAINSVHGGAIRCVDNTACVGMGLVGDCCPDAHGQSQSCCHDPLNVATVTTTRRGACDDNSACAALKLQGACCPDTSGNFLGCCKSSNNTVRAPHAVAASCAFLTPIGHKNNTLIMGPGGYGFGDYWRMGLPLEILVVATAIPMILLVWPL